MIICYWLLDELLLKEYTMHDISRVVLELNTLFYADNGFISSNNSELLGLALPLLICYFEQVGLRLNPSKTKFMTCIPSAIQRAVCAEVYTHHWGKALGSPTVL